MSGMMTLTPQLQAQMAQQASMIRMNGDILASTKWRPFMEGIEDPWIRSCTATLLENQDNYLRQLNETTLTYSPGIATFEKFAFMGSAFSQ